MKKKLLHTLLPLCLLSACSGDDALIPDVVQKENTLELYVTANGFIADGNPATRATDNGNATTFDDGDRVGVIVLDGSNILANNIPYQYSSGSARWTFDASNGEGKSIYYYDNKLSNPTYIVYYPYSSEADKLTSVAGLKTKFAPKADQSNKDAYRASDLMVWTSTGIAQKQLNAELTHAYASVALSLKLKCTLATHEEITYATTKISDVNCTLNNGTPIFPYQLGDGSYRYILPADFRGEVRWFFTYEDNTYNSPRSLSETISNKCYSSVTQIDLGEYTLDKAEVGDFYIKSADGNSGYLIPGEVASLPNEVNCLGIVFKMGKDNDNPWKDDCTYTLKNGTTPMSTINGYVLALYDANDGNTCQWGSYGTSVTHSDMNREKETGFYGYKNTNAIKAFAAGNGKTLQTDFPATYYATVDYESKYAAPANSSGWFLPSAGQGKYWLNNRDMLLTSVKKATGNSSYSWKDLYWSSSESEFYPVRYALVVDFDYGYVSLDDKKFGHYVRSVFAF